MVLNLYKLFEDCKKWCRQIVAFVNENQFRFRPRISREVRVSISEIPRIPRNLSVVGPERADLVRKRLCDNPWSRVFLRTRAHNRQQFTGRLGSRRRVNLSSVLKGEKIYRAGSKLIQYADMGPNR